MINEGYFLYLIKHKFYVLLSSTTFKFFYRNKETFLISQHTQRANLVVFLCTMVCESERLLFYFATWNICGHGIFAVISIQ